MRVLVVSLLFLSTEPEFKSLLDIEYLGAQPRTRSSECVMKYSSCINVDIRMEQVFVYVSIAKEEKYEDILLDRNDSSSLWCL